MCHESPRVGHVAGLDRVSGDALGVLLDLMLKRNRARWNRGPPFVNPMMPGRRVSEMKSSTEGHPRAFRHALLSRERQRSLVWD